MCIPRWFLRASPFTFQWRAPAGLSSSSPVVSLVVPRHTSFLLQCVWFLACYVFWEFSYLCRFLICSCMLSIFFPSEILRYWSWVILNSLSESSNICVTSESGSDACFVFPDCIFLMFWNSVCSFFLAKRQTALPVLDTRNGSASASVCGAALAGVALCVMCAVAVSGSNFTFL